MHCMFHRLIVGHTHFDVDQRHSVLSRVILGFLGMGDLGRAKLHSLSSFKRAAEKAHSDLLFFAECTANYDFVTWLKDMESKHEKGLSSNLQYQLRRGGDGVILVRTKPRMSRHVPYSSWRQIWPVEESAWPKRGHQPTAPAFDSHPSSQAPQKWKNFDK